MGTVTGRGKLELFAGRHTIGANHISAATLEIAAGSTTLDSDLGYSGDFLLDGSASALALLQLNGYTLNLKGSATLDDVIEGPETARGAADRNSPSGGAGGR